MAICWWERTESVDPQQIQREQEDTDADRDAGGDDTQKGRIPETISDSVIAYSRRP
ncbi:hypothetical protein [Natrialba sp. INN-245]|uniref:hypothetical protein n=1 Tax=Natrialba sp. INN-245 TaxID=2690967 RepID=UPI0013131E22|nr:hypothetical protein [Natrialba sp. INN-245]MWV38263.1 hypothetical protein [Natrialba sp. INN-245]